VVKAVISGCLAPRVMVVPFLLGFTRGGVRSRHQNRSTSRQRRPGGVRILNNSQKCKKTLGFRPLLRNLRKRWGEVARLYAPVHHTRLYTTTHHPWVHPLAPTVRTDQGVRRAEVAQIGRSRHAQNWLARFKAQGSSGHPKKCRTLSGRGPRVRSYRTRNPALQPGRII